MCSDGLLEAEDPRGDTFGPERMVHVLSTAAPESRFGRLRAAVMGHLDGQPSHDDVSLLAIECPRNVGKGTGKKVAFIKENEEMTCVSCNWRLGLRLSAAELKTLDILPFLMEWIAHVKVEADHRGQIFLILAELFNNALDHGLLGLDSSLKSDPEEGFERYIAERTARLEALEDGFIEIELESVRQCGGKFLQLKVKDSGVGFDYQGIVNADAANSMKRFGRGVALLRELCTKVTYLGNGNEVITQYQLTNSEM
jgi:hypothetical protein